MGVNFTQYCILGLEVDCDELKVVTSPEKYESQPRYNTKTGEITHRECVVIQEEQSHYEFLGCVDECIYELGLQLEDMYDIDFIYDNDCNVMYLGKKLGDEYDCGRVDLLSGYENIPTVVEWSKELAKTLHCNLDDITLNFTSHVG